MITKAAPPSILLADIRRSAASIPGIKAIFSALLLIDLFFLFLHVLESMLLRSMFGSDGRITILRLDHDRSVSEFWGYFQVALCLFLLVRSYTKFRRHIDAAMAATFLLILLDDALSLHETLGRELSRIWPAIIGQSTGEILVWSIAGAVLCPSILWSIVRSDSDAANFGAILCGALAMLVFFGIGIDTFHSLANGENPYLSGSLAILEDFGELVSLSVALMIVYVYSYKMAPVKTPDTSMA